MFRGAPRGKDLGAGIRCTSLGEKLRTTAGKRVFSSEDFPRLYLAYRSLSFRAVLRVFSCLTCLKQETGLSACRNRKPEAPPGWGGAFTVPQRVLGTVIGHTSPNHNSNS